MIDRRQFLRNISLTALASVVGNKASAIVRPPAPLERSESLFSPAEIYQEGTDQAASWLYAGFLPRMQDPERVRVVASYAGLSVRVSMLMTPDEVADYADYICQRAQQIEQLERGLLIQWGSGIKKTSFEALDEGFYRKFKTTVATRFQPMRGAGYQANLQLLKELFPMSVFERKGLVEFHMVFPTTPPASPERRERSDFRVQAIDERRSFYSVEKSHIFGGFPALWFNGNVGFHGPIRYVDSGDDASMLKGRLSDTGKGADQKMVSKRWQLHRAYESHGCYRLEHVLAMRAMLPAEATGDGKQPALYRVRVTVLKDFDYIDIDGDGQKELIGVKYYWIRHQAKPNEKIWKQRFYAGVDTSRLYEFPYLDPGAVQIKISGGRPEAMMAMLNRAPYGL